MRRETGDWEQFRSLPDCVEIDVRDADARHDIPRWQSMMDVRRLALEALETAQREGKRFVLFVHGSPKVFVGRRTARSEIRLLLTAHIEATPYLRRRDCIQHDCVFVAAIRPLRGQRPEPDGTGDSD